MPLTYVCTVYGLTFRLPFPCPMLPVAPDDAAEDVTVSYGPVPMEISSATASDNSWKMGFCWQASPGRFLLKGGMRAGRFLVENGKRITINRNHEALDERILFHLLHSATAAVLRQKGFFVLHASAVNTPAGAIALCGESGAGKSTALSVMLRNGCSMLADDITVLRLGAGGSVEVMPGLAQIHLWEDAARGLGLDVSGFDRHPLRHKKTAVPVNEALWTEPSPLRALYILEPYPGKALRVSCVTGTDKFALLHGCVYGPIFPEEHPGLFPLFAAAAHQTDVFLLQWPEGHSTINEVAKVILNG